MASLSGSYAPDLAHHLVFSHEHLPPLLLAFSSQNRMAAGKRGCVDSLFQVDGLPESAMGLLFSSFPFLFCVVCLLVSVSTETLHPHAAGSAFLASVIKDGYGSSAVPQLSPDIDKGCQPFFNLTLPRLLMFRLGFYFELGKKNPRK